jgi:hypothetical protein
MKRYQRHMDFSGFFLNAGPFAVCIDFSLHSYSSRPSLSRSLLKLSSKTFLPVCADTAFERPESGMLLKQKRIAQGSLTCAEILAGLVSYTSVIFWSE